MITINSVINLEVKTREDELNDLVNKNGQLCHDIDYLIIKIRNETEPKDEEKWWTQFDNKLEEYVQFRIELDRLERTQLYFKALLYMIKKNSRLVDF